MAKRHHRGRRTQPQKSKGLIVLLIFVMVVFIFSAVQLFLIYWEYHVGKAEYDKISAVVIKENDSGSREDGTDVYIDFDALKKKNRDVIGWIRFPHPSEINYPIVQGEDNSQYLTRTFEADDNKLGAIFMDYENASDFSDQNTFIYGHHMDNGSMFAQLMKYEKESYFKKHPYFFIYTPDDKVIKYTICSAGRVEDSSDSFTQFFESEEEFLRYQGIIQKASTYDTGTILTKDSRIVSLSTCTNQKATQRFLVHGALTQIKDTSLEKAKNSK